MKKLEIILIAIASVIAIFWFFNPTGNFEPVIVFLTLAATLGTEIYRRKTKTRPVGNSSEDESKNKLEMVISKLWDKLKQLLRISKTQKRFLHSSESAAFFAERFGQAFPGIRSTTWFKEQEAVKRLKVLLQKPLSFKAENSITTPIWWWRYGNLQITRFRALNKETVLLDTKELLINRIAAVYNSSYKRLFVYVEAKAMPPTGLYEWSEEKIKEWVVESGYAWEEYSVYKNKHLLTRAEHDDNAAIIKGKHVKLNGADELRERYITPYNFVIASHHSPINNPDFDSILCESLNGVLANEVDISDLADQVNQLPNARIY